MTILRMLATPSLRHIAAAQILEEARSALDRTQGIRAEHVARVQRIARETVGRLSVSPAMKTERAATVLRSARNTLDRVSRLYPTPEDELRQRARQFRQERAARILKDARNTVRPSASIDVASRIVRKVKEDARIRHDERGCETEQRSARTGQQQEKPPQAAPIDWTYTLDERLAYERERTSALLAHVVAEILYGSPYEIEPTEAL
jgi:hypothetical protein